MQKVRIYLKKGTYDKLIKLLNERGGKAIVKEIEESFKEWKKVYSNKKNSTGNATRKKIENTKKKIEKAINQILKNNESLSLYNIAKVAGMSYNTIAKKEYKKFILEVLEKKQPEIKEEYEIMDKKVEEVAVALEKKLNELMRKIGTGEIEPIEADKIKEQEVEKSDKMWNEYRKIKAKYYNVKEFIEKLEENIN